MNESRPITVLVCALGGEGGGVLSEWLYDAALCSGHAAQSTSIPGVAQRTGATTYYIEIDPRPGSATQGRRPVFCLNPVPGAIDLLVSSELLETVRQIGNGFATADRTTVLSSTARALTVMEKMQLGDGRVDDAALLATLREHARRAELLDLPALARSSGAATSALLLGAIAASAVLPLSRTACEQAIRRSGKGVDASLRGFAAAFEQVSKGRAVEAASGGTVPPPALPDALRRRFPGELHDLLALGHARLIEYQDDAYAALYIERLQRVLDAERAGDPAGAGGWRTTREATRWLALWMAFDDIVRVAELKLRPARASRVRLEVAARDDEIVKVWDHFKPGVAEFAALLPDALAARLQAWDAKRRAGGRAPWALPLKVGTHTIAGALALRVLAGMKGQRRRGSRFTAEQALVERWLVALERGACEHPALGFEIAQCGRLIKGYGSTNERDKQHLLHVVDHLAFGPAAAEARASAIRAAREAALADDSGRALDLALVAHGAPARPAREQPIRWYRHRPQADVTAVPPT